jgi:hypothetical protein
MVRWITKMTSPPMVNSGNCLGYLCQIMGKAARLRLRQSGRHTGVAPSSFSVHYADGPAGSMSDIPRPARHRHGDQLYASIGSCGFVINSRTPTSEARTPETWLFCSLLATKYQLQVWCYASLLTPFILSFVS